MENLDLVYQITSDSQSPTHSRPAERGSRQAIQARPDHPNGVVPPSRGLPNIRQQVAPASNRSICHEVQQQFAPVCVTGTGSPGFSSGCTQPAMGGSGRVCLPTSSHLGQSGGEVAEPPYQRIILMAPGWPNMPWLWDLVSMSSQILFYPTESAQPAQSVDTALQSDPSQKSDKSKSPCMAPRASAIKEQGFSEVVAARIEAPQRGSTRSVYEAKWAIYYKVVCHLSGGLQGTPLKSVADFLMYLFQDRKLQPSTMDGYRSAIADKLVNSPINNSKEENLTCLLDSFHRDRPKGRRGIPSWNFSLVLH